MGKGLNDKCSMEMSEELSRSLSQAVVGVAPELIEEEMLHASLQTPLIKDGSVMSAVPDEGADTWTLIEIRDDRMGISRRTVSRAEAMSAMAVAA